MSGASETQTGLERDPTDLRDRYFTPSLRPLAASSVETFLSRVDRATGVLPYTLRDQKSAGTCAGQALANLIDLDLIRAAGPHGDRPPPVSARMLYRMGVNQEGGSAEDEDGVRSLRSVIKGFYHNGVCPDAMWPDAREHTELTPERAKKARETTLGAYYRLHPHLNDYHAALSEADCILVSAEIHEGWAASRIENGVISIGSGSPANHAFLIVGYNDRGFLVLNSYGKDWGRYSAEGLVLAGVALWTYEDWAEKVLDAWVLRLGVPSPGAFRYTTARQGIFFADGPIRAGSAPSHQLLGHFAHLDDGRHVPSGSYASSRDSVAMTAGRIATQPERPVWLSLPGSLLGINHAFQVEVGQRPVIEGRLGMYPYTVFWCNDMVESTSAVLEHLFSTAVAKVGALSPALNDEIESVTGGIGRAFWRDIKRAARLAGQHRHLRRTDPPIDADDLECGKDGAAAALFDGFAATGAKLHLVADGAGVLLLEQYLLSIGSDSGGRRIADRRAAFFDAVSSLTLIAPTIEAGPFIRAFGPLIAELKTKGPGRATLWAPTFGFERKLTVGHYTRSILDLVLYGFEGVAADRTYIGMSAKRSGIGALTGPGQPLDGLELGRIRTPDHGTEPAHTRRRHYRQEDVVLDQQTLNAIIKRAADIKQQDEGKGA